MTFQAFRMSLVAAAITIAGFAGAPTLAHAQDTRATAATQAQPAAAKPRVVVLATGGTIAGAGASAMNSAGRPPVVFRSAPRPAQFAAHPRRHARSGN